MKSFGLFFSRPYVEFQSANYTLVSNNDWASRRTVTFENGSKKKRKKKRPHANLDFPFHFLFLSLLAARGLAVTARGNPRESMA